MAFPFGLVFGFGLILFRVWCTLLLCGGVGWLVVLFEVCMLRGFVVLLRLICGMLVLILAERLNSVGLLVFGCGFKCGVLVVCVALGCWALVRVYGVFRLCFWLCCDCGCFFVLIYFC